MGQTQPLAGDGDYGPLYCSMYQACFECNYNDIPEDGRHAELHSPRHARESENTNALFCLTALAGTPL